MSANDYYNSGPQQPVYNTGVSYQQPLQQSYGAPPPQQGHFDPNQQYQPHQSYGPPSHDPNVAHTQQHTYPQPAGQRTTAPYNDPHSATPAGDGDAHGEPHAEGERGLFSAFSHGEKGGDSSKSGKALKYIGKFVEKKLSKKSHGGGHGGHGGHSGHHGGHGGHGEEHGEEHAEEEEEEQSSSSEEEDGGEGDFDF